MLESLLHVARAQLGMSQLSPGAYDFILFVSQHFPG